MKPINDIIIKDQEIFVSELLDKIHKLENKLAIAITMTASAENHRDRLIKEINELRTQMDSSQATEWQCPHCFSSSGTWFSRTLNEKGEMSNVCNNCGQETDEIPVSGNNSLYWQ